jgi:RNA polymerase sigma-70 factor (ECF subfamily)
MAYNKAKEERKWQLWKEAEEQQMRQLGVSEDTIEKLRVHDWSVFNADRRYYEKLQETGTYLEEVAESDTLSEIKTVDDFLDSIENEYLYQMLMKADRITLQVAFLKIQGFSYREIALRLDTTEKSVYRRMDRLKEKMKKILK